MDNIYSLFYTGQQNPYGIGAWDSKGRKLKHSSSQPSYHTNSKTLPPIMAEQMKKNTQNSSSNQKIKLPVILSRPESHHRHRKNSRRYRTNSSGSESSYQYDANKNRKELSNFVKDINNSIAVRLQNDNFIAQQKLNNIKNNYNEIKTLLNNKIDKLEQDQQMQFDNLKYALEQGGGLKMMGAVRNANGGNNYDLKRAEEEDMIDATRKLPKLLEDKINIINNMKRKEKQDEKRLLSQVRKKVNEEIRKQKEKDEMRFKKEIDEIEQKRENIRQERKRLMEELQRNDIEDSISNSIYTNLPQPQPQTTMTHPLMPGMYPSPAAQIIPQYPYAPPMYPPPMNNNNNNNNDSTNEFLKIFLLKKLFDDKPQTVQASPPQIPQFIPTPYPQIQPPAAAPQIQYQQQPIPYPQPIIYQSPAQAANPPNVIIQQERGQPQIVQQPNPQYKDVVITKSETLNSDKGIPFIDPLEEYLEATKSRRTKSKNKSKTKSSSSKSRTKTKSKSKSKKSTSKKKSSKKKSSKKQSKKKDEEEEEDSTPPPIKLKLIDPDNKESKDVYPKEQKKDNKAKKSTKGSKNSKKKDSKSKKKEQKPKKKKEEEEEEEEEDDEEEEEEEDDEEEEEEEDDDEDDKKKQQKKKK